MFFHRETESERLDKLKALLVLTEAYYAHMQRVNDYFREHGTTLGCPGVTPDAAEIFDEEIKNRGPSDNLPYSEYDVLRDYYEIQRLKREITEIEGRMDTFVEWTFPGGEAIVNKKENRLQLKFDQSLGAAKRVILRCHGFSRASLDNVWERRLDREAIRAAAHIRFLQTKDGASPEEIQPYT